MKLNRHHGGLLRRLLATLWLLCLGVSPLHAAGAQSLQSFLELKPQWPDLVGSRFRIEGHYAILGRDSLRMKNCDLPFKSAQPIKLTGTSKVVEISGRLAKDGTSGKLFFEIEQIRSLPTDLQTLAERERSISRGTSQQWYDLADWARKRGQFYDDDELLERAKLANRKGLNLERQELKELTPGALRNLAARVPQLGLEEALRLDWLHESYWLEWEQLQKTVPKPDPAADEFDLTKDPVFQFLQRLDKDFPTQKVRADNVQPLLANEYARNPVLTYHNAPDSKRRLLERLFHVQVATVAIARLTKPDGSNGSEVADHIDELIPEQHDLAEKHRDAELAYQAKNAATLSRNQLTDLVQRCRERQQETLAKDALTRWFQRRESSLRKDGVTGLTQLADERLALWQDQTGAGALLLEALQLEPNNENVIERLKKLGYQEVNGEWIHPQASPRAAGVGGPATSESPLERNIRLGIPSVGMTSTQLLKCLGAPQSLTRVATAGRVTETWIYRDGPRVRYAVTVERRPSRGTTEVIAVR